ncbi:MAG: ATP-binding cassette domain-containing protein [Lentimicrobiaceae bacterium]|nr:ATP-binding cassette domain-containing protein [Lentimicrobiaceae bacterium]
MNQDILHIRQVSKKYVNHLALNNVSISVPENSIFGLLGPNGAGKTTLIRIINQITGPDTGEIIFQNEKLQPIHLAKIGYLPEERGLYKKMKVGEQALYLSQLKGLSRQDALKSLKYWFEKFELKEWWNHKVEELSKGMQQKVQFIITVIHKPQLLIFDEPFSGFDPINVNLLKEEILSLQKQGATIIFSTHNMASVEELCDHIALINKSEKILDGRVKEIKNTYKSNTFGIEFTNARLPLVSILQPGYDIINYHADDELHKADIKIPAGISPNKLLEVLIPHVELHAFNEVLPTMNDIFIRTVTHAAASLS